MKSAYSSSVLSDTSLSILGKSFGRGGGCEEVLVADLFLLKVTKAAPPRSKAAKKYKMEDIFTPSLEEAPLVAEFSETI